VEAGRQTSEEERGWTGHADRRRSFYDDRKERLGAGEVRMSSREIFDMSFQEREILRRHYQRMITAHLAAGNEFWVQKYHERLLILNTISRNKRSV
jgi:hypothetical protein